MLKRSQWIFGFVFMVSILMVFELNACQSEVFKGSLSISGSTTIQPISNKLSEAFREQNPDVVFKITGGGSAAGINDVAAGIVDIGAASRNLKANEPVLLEYLIGRDGIGIISHSSNQVRSLTKSQIVQIFSGSISDWQEVDGKKMEVIPVTREEGSGTLTAFKEMVMGETPISSKAVNEPGNSDVLSFVSTNPGAIGFISIGLIDSSVNAVQVDNIACSLANCKSGVYPFVRPLFYLVKTEPQGLTRAFLDFATGKNGQKIIKQEGYMGIN